MGALFSMLARRRAAGVGLAILVEIGILLPLAYAEPSAVVGIAAAVAAAIAGTVAVVFGPVDGALVALAGAAVFAAAGGFGAGELAALVVWPAIVAAAGLVGRRVGQQRAALAELVAAHETERQRIASELHDEAAQVLAAALLTLKQVEEATTADEAGAASETTRRLIQETISSIRDLAVELRPKALDDFGLVPAVDRLASSFAARTGVTVDFDARTEAGRLSPLTEITVYRAVQEVLALVEQTDGAGAVRVTIERAPENVRVAIVGGGLPGRHGAGSGSTFELAALRERVRLAGGRLSASSGPASASVRLELPL
jgi:signal transduction histidine kinase